MEVSHEERTKVLLGSGEETPITRMWVRTEIYSGQCRRIEGNRREKRNNKCGVDAE